MLSQDLRKKFLQYFKSKGHAIIPSSLSVPHNDPTLLFINAGMNQFKDVFLGKATRDYTRATSSQKCIRVGGKHNDLDNVGHTKRHLTFFEMLGNFSFGDYFKKEAIHFAWEVATSVFNFPEERLFISVYEKDEEAYTLWKEIVDEKKISRIGEKDNFWSMGETGPCGPCSELFFDRGPEFGEARAVHEDLDSRRFLEFWNLVFMEYNRDANGAMPKLPNQSVDTGAGLERVLALMANVTSVFQTDVLRSLIAQVEKIAKKPYDFNDSHHAPAFHVIADHVRSLAFAIADGAEPSNIERGYVLRKILRRAVRYGRTLGLSQPFLAQVLPKLIETMGSDFPELKSSQTRIADLLTIEEESFLRTLHKGGNILSGIIDQAEKSQKKEISGDAAFKLKDTYGFPLEEILLIAKDSGLSVNLDQYQILEAQAKQRSRQSKQTHHQVVEKSVYEDFVSEHGTSEFVGYDEVEIEATIEGLFIDGKSVNTLSAKESGIIILDQTPFYAEKGGQVGDTGHIIHKKAHFIVKDCQSPFPGLIAHIGYLENGTLMVGEPVVAKIHAKRRNKIAKHHTATHLLHYALQEVLGPHIRQAGSLVEESRLRFDFHHHKALTKEEVRQIEQIVNEKIWETPPLKTYHLPLEEVQNHPEIKQFFGEKYGQLVRVVEINDYSKELCGGTHVKELGTIGSFRIAKEGSIAKGVRRIEAVSGPYAEDLRYEMEDRLLNVSHLLKSNLSKLEETVKTLIKDNERLKEQALFARKKELKELASSLMSKIKKVGNAATLFAVVDVSKKEMVELGNDLIEQIKSGVILLCQMEGGKCQLLLRVSQDLVEQGIHANALIKELAIHIDGSGGGKKNVAQAGGKNPKGVIIAFDKIKEKLDK